MRKSINLGEEHIVSFNNKKDFKNFMKFLDNLDMSEGIEIFDSNGENIYESVWNIEIEERVIIGR